MSSQKLRKTGQKLEKPIQSVGDRHRTVIHNIVSFVSGLGTSLPKKYKYEREDDFLYIALKDDADEVTCELFSKKILFEIVEVIRARHDDYIEYIGFLFYAASLNALKGISIQIADRSEMIELEFQPFFSSVHNQVEKFQLDLPYPPAN